MSIKPLFFFIFLLCLNTYTDIISLELTIFEIFFPILVYLQSSFVKIILNGIYKWSTILYLCVILCLRVLLLTH